LAAEQGDTKAQVDLGFMYATGEGVVKDDVQAYAWFYLAVARGNKIASQNKDIARKKMTPTQIAEAQKLSKKLCAKIPGCMK
jgi:TPR repeat protein